MALLELEQVFAVVVKAHNGSDMPLDTSDPDFPMKVMMSPCFTNIMYVDRFCGDVIKSGDLSKKKQCSIANEVMADTLKHRWVKHLKPLDTNCGASFLSYCEKQFNESKCIVKTLSECLNTMSLFENVYSYEEPLDIFDPIPAIRDEFTSKMEDGASIEQLNDLIRPELRVDGLIKDGLRYYEQMCEAANKDASRLFEKTTATSVAKKESPTVASKKSGNSQPKDSPFSFSKAAAQIVGGIICMYIGFAIPEGGFLKYAFTMGGLVGIAKGIFTLFVSSSAAIWKKAPKPKIAEENKLKFKVLLICTLLLIVWCITLIIINVSLDQS